MEIKKTYGVKGVATVDITDDVILVQNRNAGFMSVSIKDIRGFVNDDFVTASAHVTELFQNIMVALAKEYDKRIEDVQSCCVLTMSALPILSDLMEVSK